MDMQSETSSVGLEESSAPKTDELQEVAGCLCLEGDEFNDLRFDYNGYWTKKVRRASEIPIYEKPKDIDTKGATRYEFQLIAPYLYWYEEMLQNEGKGDIIPADDQDGDDNIKFLRQIWKDKGYGVDCYPTPDFGSPFYPIPSPNQSEMVKENMQLAMSAMNDHTREKYNKTYRLLEVEDAVWTQTASYYFTFTAKQDGGDQVVERFRAMVSILPPPTRLLEYKRQLN